MERNKATLGENHGNQNPHLIQLILWKPGNGLCVLTGTQISLLGSGGMVGPVVCKGRVGNNYIGNMHSRTDIFGVIQER